MSKLRMVMLMVVAFMASACKSPSSTHQQSAKAAPEKTAELGPSTDIPTTPGSLGGNLVRDGDGLLATWIEPTTQPAATGSTRRGPHRVRFARFANHRWSTPVTVVESASVLANWADTPSVVRGGDGVLVAHWAERTKGGTYAYNVALARSTDDGATWNRIGLAHDDGTPTEHGFVSLIAEPSGVRAFWLDGRGMDKNSGPMTLRTASVGEAVGASEVVDPRVCDCCGTSAVTTPSGPVVVYRDRSASEVRDIWIVRRHAGEWTQPTAVHNDQWTVPGCPVNGPAIAAAGGQLAIAWYTYAGERASVRVAFSDDDGQHFGAPIEVDGPHGRSAPIGRVDIELVGTGQTVVTWMSSDRENAVVYARRVSARGLVGPALSLLETAATRDAGFPKIARVGDALGLLYTETGERTRVRFRLIPLATLDAADSQPTAPQAASAGLLALGSRAPAFKVSTLDGSPASLADLAGDVTLVNLWATWCEPCRHEMPVLAKLHRAHKGKGFRVIAISVDRDRTADELATFTARRKLPFAVWHDPKDRSSKEFGAGALPASFLFDRSGQLIWRRAGAIREGDKSLQAALRAALSTRPK